MHNTFVAELFDWGRGDRPVLARANRLLVRAGLPVRVRSPRGSGVMSRVEWRVNLFHLLEQVLVYGVPGAVVELGAYEGETAVLAQRVIAGTDPGRPLHLFDVFDVPGVREALDRNVRAAGLPPPVVHEGLVQDTVPDRLPDQVAFAHLDLGATATTDAGETVEHVLRHLWPRVAPGGVVLLNEYVDRAVFAPELDEWPGYAEAVRRLAPELGATPSVLWAGETTQGVLRKPLGSPATA